jgi:hypothetical protein
MRMTVDTLSAIEGDGEGGLFCLGDNHKWLEDAMSAGTVYKLLLLSNS